MIGVNLLLATPGVGHADNLRMDTLSVAAIPDRATVEVRLPEAGPSGDPDVTNDLAKRLAVILKERGYRPVDRSGELIVRFVAEEPTYASLQRTADNVHKIDFNPAEGLTLSDPDRRRLRISVARPAQPPFWTGVIERDVKSGEPLEVYLSMTNALMRHWGKTFDGS